MLKIVVITLFLVNQSVWAGNYLYPKNAGDQLLGNQPEQPFYTKAKQEDTLLDIARAFDIGQNEIVLANPDVDRWLPGENTRVRIPDSRLLPDAPQQGMVLNLAEFRLYYYPEPKANEERMVSTYPISIGRVDWDTPLGTTRVIAKNQNPVWRPPKSIKEEHAAEGDILPDVFPAGPDNPLGLFAIRLAVPGYLIHSTNKPYGVGMRVSHGCIRMYPEDIEILFSKIEVGVSVHIVNQAIKVGWSEQKLYIEVYPELEGNEISYEESIVQALDLIENANGGQLPVLNGQMLKQALTQRNGIPTAVFERKLMSSLDETQKPVPD